jgi:hypothetical protein
MFCRIVKNFFKSLWYVCSETLQGSLRNRENKNRIPPFFLEILKKNSGGILMPRRNKPVNPKAENELDSLKEEVAEDLHLDDDIKKRGWENMTTREVGKIGGNMVRKMIDLAEEEMDKKEGKINNDRETREK